MHLIYNDYAHLKLLAFQHIARLLANRLLDSRLTDFRVSESPFISKGKGHLENSVSKHLFCEGSLPTYSMLYQSNNHFYVFNK